MTSRTALSLALGALLGVAAGCGDAAPPAGPSAPPPAAPHEVPSAPAFPVLSRDGQIYVAADSLYAGAVAYHGSRLASRYVLYADGSFGLQFSSRRFGFHEYPGRYARTGAGISFAFDDANAAGPWTATGILEGDRLRIDYSPVMYMADFEAGTYHRSPATR